MIAMTPGSTNSVPAINPPRVPVHQPADIHGQLLGLRARQQHAVVQGVQEPRFADPSLLLDEDAVHHRDLAGRTPEAQRGNAAPHTDGLTQGDPMRRRGREVLTASFLFSSGPRW